MSNWLFEHNQTAYDAAVAMLAQTGKAAIIHPTGTGKSFIGFQLCVDHPEETVCWLSPSAYIFETQCENFKTVSNQIVPENIRFFTYAKLMQMTDAEIADIHPDYIILDEFHRCGAEMWGAGVQALLAANLHVPILGLSATAIRYLDNQRDMADELFEGNVASEITLGEAIVRGILNPPKYVLSAYSYQKDLERYRKSIEKHQNKAVRDSAQRYLDALRRALENADGMDEIFAKHMECRFGKYIVFCANAEHMQEMIEKVPDWFCKVDTDPHIYSAYSNDPETSLAFADFKKDTSDRLKLLFCIDMLNEGVHIDDIDGVILLRPTVSPIIYKQQIGRALSAGKQRNVVIFDIVMNIMNLYSIGALEQEMDAAISYYRFLGEEQNIVTERFRVVDELHDCKVLFEKLNDTLTASWDVMYGIAQQYYQKHGNLTPTNRYRTEEGYSLGSWLATQRSIRKGTVYGSLSEERIRKLDAIGMRWDSHLDVKWDKCFASLEKYKEEFGNVDLSGDYVTADGVELGLWVQRLRTYRNSGIQGSYLTPERIRKLDALGMIWDKLDYLWEQNYLQAAEYYRMHRNLNVPRRHKTQDGVALGTWLHNILSEYRDSEGKSLTPIQKERLEAIGMVLPDIRLLEQQWHNGYAEAKTYFEENGDLDVPYYFSTEDGFPLGTWIRKQRKLAEKDPKKRCFPLPEERRKLLNVIGMIWDAKTADPWHSYLALVRQYYGEYGHIDVPTDEKYKGAWLGQWLIRQRSAYQQGKLSAEKISALDSLGFDWRSTQERRWETAYEKAAAYHARHGHLVVTKEDKELQQWLSSQRNKYRDGKLSVKEIQALDALGMIWETDSTWDSFFAEAERFYEAQGHLDIPAAYVTESGMQLGHWYHTQRTNYKNGTLTEERIKRLESIGIQWQPVKIRSWMQYYGLAKQYWEQNGNLQVPVDFVTESNVKLGSWISGQRERYCQGGLVQEQIDLLEQIGMEWNRFDARWEQGYACALAYRQQHGDLKVAASYETDDGFCLGSWIRGQRSKFKAGKLTEDQIRRLNELDMVWSAADSSWEQGFQTARAYAQKNGSLDISSGLVTEDGSRLGQWVYNQKKKHRAGKLDQEKVKLLCSIGVCLD